MSGITVRDKILPKVDGSSGAWRSRRSEDVAFLYEALFEREESDSDSDSDSGSGSASFRSDVPVFHVDYKFFFRGARRDKYDIYNNIRELLQYSTCDASRIGDLEDRDLVSSDAYTSALTEFYPILDSGFATRRGDLASSAVVSSDQLRRMYYDLMHHEARICPVLAVGSDRTESTGSAPRTVPYEGNLYGRLCDRSHDLGNSPSHYDFTRTIVSVRPDFNPYESLWTRHVGNELVMVVRFKVTAYWGQTGYSNSFLGYFARVVSADRFASFSEEVISEAFGFVDARYPGWWDSRRASFYLDVGSCDMLVPFSGRTKLRDIAWNWTPSSS